MDQNETKLWIKVYVAVIIGAAKAGRENDSTAESAGYAANAAVEQYRLAAGK